MSAKSAFHGVSISYSIIGNNLRKARNANSMRQEDLADRLGISPPHYSNCERGKRSISLEMIVAACQILDVTIEQILSGAIVGARISEGNDNQQITAGNRDVILWRQEMKSIQLGCSDLAKEIMLDSCHKIAELDRTRR